MKQKTKKMIAPTMRIYEATIEGITGLIWDRRKKELDDDLLDYTTISTGRGKSKKDPNKFDEWQEINWWKKAEYDKNKNVYIPPQWLKQCFIKIAQYEKTAPSFNPKGNATCTSYYKNSVIYEIPNSICKIDDLEKIIKWCPPSGHFISKPMLGKWNFKFIMYDNDGRLILEEHRSFLERAGRLIGIGSNRSLGYGRFIVKEFKERSN